MFRDVGIDLPTGGDAAELAGFARDAEATGFDSLWTVDSSGPRSPSPLAVLGHVAALTTAPRLGVAVLLSALHSPVHLAREVATLDVLSGGRLTLGVGLGHDRGAYAKHGLSPQRRAQRFERGVVLLRRLLTEPSVSAEGPWWTLTDQPRPVQPLQQPAPPLWFGARTAPALERAVRIGDGWIGAGSMSSDAFLDALSTVRAQLADARRDPAGFAIAKRVYVHVGPHNPGTIAALDRWFEAHYRDGAMADRVMVSGSAADVVAGLSRLREAGVATLVLSPVLDRRVQMQHLAEEVVPQLPPPA